MTEWALAVSTLQPSNGLTRRSLCLKRQYLSPAIVTTRRTGSVGRHRAATLRAFIQVQRMPAVRRLAGAQAHLRRFAFWNSHGCALPKHPFFEKQVAHKRSVKELQC